MVIAIAFGLLHLTATLPCWEKKPERRHKIDILISLRKKTYRDLEFVQITRTHNLKEKVHHE